MKNKLSPLENFAVGLRVLTCGAHRSKMWVLWPTCPPSLALYDAFAREGGKVGHEPHISVLRASHFGTPSPTALRRQCLNWGVTVWSDFSSAPPPGFFYESNILDCTARSLLANYSPPLLLSTDLRVFSVSGLLSPLPLLPHVFLRPPTSTERLRLYLIYFGLLWGLFFLKISILSMCRDNLK